MVTRHLFLPTVRLSTLHENRRVLGVRYACLIAVHAFVAAAGAAAGAGAGSAGTSAPSAAHYPVHAQSLYSSMQQVQQAAFLLARASLGRCPANAKESTLSWMSEPGVAGFETVNGAAAASVLYAVSLFEAVMYAHKVTRPSYRVCDGGAWFVGVVYHGHRVGEPGLMGLFFTGTVSVGAWLAG